MKTCKLLREQVAAATRKQKSRTGAEKCTDRQCIYPVSGNRGHCH